MKKLLLLLFVGQAALVQAQVCAGSLTGHVHHSASHENLAGATVELLELQRTLTTNSKGDFRFDALCAGHYTLRISHVSFDTIVRYVGLQGTAHIDVDMPVSRTVLEGVTVAAQRNVPMAGTRSEVSGTALEEARGRSFSDALAKINGVTLLQTGSTIAKPIIHGLHGNRILTINNGVRQEGQQWGNEHAPEVDPFIAGKIAVVTGVDQLRYGSDAIGGIILVEPKPIRQAHGNSGEVNAVYGTNNRQGVVSGLWEGASQKWDGFNYRLQGTLKRSGNVATPGYRLNNTASREGNFSIAGGYRRHHFQTELFYSYFQTKIGLFTGAHIGNTTDFEQALNAAKPDPTFTGQQSFDIARPYQAVLHHLLKSKTVVDVAGHKFSLLLSGQFNDREEFDVVRSSSRRGPQMHLTIGTLQQELNWEAPRKGPWQHTAAVLAMQQSNSYSGRYYIPAYKAQNWGGYYITKWNHNALDLQGGLRFDSRAIQSNRLRAGGAEFARYDFDFNTFAASLGGGYRITDGWRVSGGATLSSRAPHINELLSNGIHQGTATFETGDINLKPEQSVYLHLGQRFNNRQGTLGGELSLYQNNIRDFIYQQPLPGEPVVTISGVYQALRFAQTDARLQGMDASFWWKPAAQWEWTGQYNLLRAKNKKTADWLIRMPADRLASSLRYTFKDGAKRSATYLMIEAQQVWRQTRVPDETGGKQDYAPPPPGYFLTHIDAGTTITIGSVPVGLGISVRNALNERYRDYLNYLRFFTDEMGRNVQLRLKVPIGAGKG